jgi:CheY-like chemotaxis protein
VIPCLDLPFIWNLGACRRRPAACGLKLFSPCNTALCPLFWWPRARYPKIMRSRRRILVADDNPLIRKMLCELFKDHEFLEICDEAVDGHDAIEKVKKHQPDLIILDLSMPKMDGLQAAIAICKILPNVPIILFTMYANVIRQTDAKVSGITRVVSKNEPHTIVGHCEELLQVA